ncbi:MAG: hypothetical protein WC593_15670 [Methanoregula sp.]
MENKLSKLPKWAQEHIANIELRNGRLTRDLAEQLAINTDTHPESNTYYQLWLDGDFTKRYLPANSHLTFIGKNTKVSVFVDHKGQIRIDIGNGLIMPQARNSIYIVPE